MYRRTVLTTIALSTAVLLAHRKMVEMELVVTLHLSRNLQGGAKEKQDHHKRKSPMAVEKVKADRENKMVGKITKEDKEQVAKETASRKRMVAG